MKNKDLTLILVCDDTTNTKGLNEYKHFFKTYNQLIVKPQEVLILKNDNEGDIVSSEFRFITYEEDTLAHKLNKGVSEVKTKYFMYVKYDSSLFKGYTKELGRHIEKEISDIYLPINYNCNHEGLFSGYMNEGVWSNTFSKELGYLDYDLLLDYPEFSLNGLTMSVKDYNKIGGLKETFKQFYEYEFLLRALKKELYVFVVPRIGTKNEPNREGSKEVETTKTISAKEYEFWFKLAKKEHNFKADRKIAYVNNEKK